MVIDSEQLEKNAESLLKKFPDAKKILKKATGQKNYKQIAQDLKINEKIVSPALKMARDLGFAERDSPGIYKKITPHMKYIPNKKEKKVNVKSVDSIIKKFTKKKTKIDITKKSVLFNYENKVNKMTLAYSWLFITENMLRDLIREVYATSDWWKTKVPKDVKDGVEQALAESKYDDAKRKDNLEYTHLGQLKKIIVHNWGDFEPRLTSKDKKTFEVDLDRVIPSRNAIGHCIPLAGDDYTYAEMRFKAVLKLLK